MIAKSNKSSLSAVVFFCTIIVDQDRLSVTNKGSLVSLFSCKHSSFSKSGISSTCSVHSLWQYWTSIKCYTVNSYIGSIDSQDSASIPKEQNCVIQGRKKHARNTKQQPLLPPFTDRRCNTSSFDIQGDICNFEFRN